jgi:ankyrin repeat protein
MANVGCPPYRLALAQNDKAQIDLLLANGEDINLMWTKRTAWETRRSIKGIPMCRYLIEFAAQSHSLEMVKFLVERGAQLDISNALHAAASNHDEEDQPERVRVIEFLLDKGMDINKLEFAGDEDFTKQYWDRAYGTPLHYAASWGLSTIVESLLRHGADPNIQARAYQRNVDRGTALDWQRSNEPDEGMYNRRVLVLLGGINDKL